MSEKKKGFTLVELMAALAILMVVLTLVGASFLQGYKMLNRANSYSIIEDEFRIAVMNIEKIIQSYDEKEIVIYTNNKKVAINSSEYNVNDQNSLMTIIPRDTNTTLDNVAYIKAKNSNGDYQLLQVTFNDSDTNKYLDTADATVIINPTEVKVLISKLSSAGDIVFTNENDIISVEITGMENLGVSRDEYNATFYSKENEDINLSLGSSGEVGDVGDGEYDQGINDFINRLGKYNINIVRDLEFKSSNGNEKVNLDGNGSISFGGSILSSDFNSAGSIVIVNEVIDNISLGINSKGSVEILSGENNISGTYMDSIVKNKYRIVLVDGNIKIGSNANDIIDLKNTIILCTGDITLEKDNIQLNMTDSIMYGKNLKEYGSANIVINNTSNSSAVIEAVKTELYKLLNEYLETIDVEYRLSEDWGVVSKYEIIIKNNTSKGISLYEMEFDCNLDIEEVWGFYFEKVNQNRYKIKNMNDYISPGGVKKIEGKCKTGEMKIENIIFNISN